MSLFFLNPLIFKNYPGLARKQWFCLNVSSSGVTNIVWGAGALQISCFCSFSLYYSLDIQLCTQSQTEHGDLTPCGSGPATETACGVSGARSVWRQSYSKRGCAGKGHSSVVVNPSSPETGETLFPHVPVPTELLPAPDKLLKIISCSFDKGCSRQCSYRRTQLPFKLFQHTTSRQDDDDENISSICRM